MDGFNPKKYKMKLIKIEFFSIIQVLLISVLFMNCESDGSSDSQNKKNSTEINSDQESSTSVESKSVQIIDKQRPKVKLGHTVNTTADEYLPVVSSDGSRLYFSAMDRTGFFDFKLDFTKQKSAGGEDVYYSNLTEGVWSDSRPISQINTNGHEVASQVFNNGDLLVTANYPEKLGSDNNSEARSQTTDLFQLFKSNSGYQINHFPEPVNSIFTESDGWMDEGRTFILFVSDRPGHMGDFHKKGFKWNESFWGNTDVYVSTKEGDSWTVPVNLGPKVNTQFAERTPWLSKDGLTLYLSSNGYLKGKHDLDVYAFKRKNLNSWNEWEGPFEIKDANSDYDDWGYKETINGDAYLASASPLGFKPTQGGRAGDGVIFQTNFRPGYEVYGLQVSSLNAEYETNIFVLKNNNKPTFVVNDVFFEFDSFLINKSFGKYLDLIIDQIKLNNSSIVEINGHTDNIGQSGYNQELSLKRALEIKKYLLSKGLNNSIVTQGFGDGKPILPNTSVENRKRNRRVEIYLKNVDGK
jgi:outer membrane protein OmpA-like peptidoglycan-associated protein